ncbi:MAG: hypothetical protein HYX48_03860 [Chlamydiales bacterium]|nr:hypothetical protein [Chlamydiales bacterium]
MSSDLLSLNQRGILPAPSESEAEFLKRIENSEEEEEINTLLSQEEWRDAHQSTRTLFGFSADWVKAFYSRSRLPFWQGAVTWLGNPPLIQLHPKFKSGSYFGFYKRSEVLAHEAVHAVRTPLLSNRFEEHFAYLTSERSWRRWLGPLFRTSFEGSLFLFTLLLAVCASYAAIWIPALERIAILPWLLLAALLLRLRSDHRIFKKCEKNLRAILPKPEEALFVMVRLTDEEIVTFSKLAPSEILHSIEKQKKLSLRWKILVVAYFKSDSCGR